jgi:NTP pyrophosphatase (non-canonical NTP hydrolase)
MDEQERVADFVATHDLETPPAYRLLDLVSELGEVSKETLTSTEYGHQPADVDVSADEIGDVLFALLAVSEQLDIDAGAALDEALTKYESRVEDAGSPGSGET